MAMNKEDIWKENKELRKLLHDKELENYEQSLFIEVLNKELNKYRKFYVEHRDRVDRD